MSADLSGRVAVVTGAAHGLGEAIATTLANEGASLILVDRDEAATNALAQTLAGGGGETVVVAGDVADGATANAVASAATRQFGRVDILVNNAGIQRYGNVVDTPEEVWDEVLGVNLKSVFLMCKACVPLMPEGSAIVNMASVQALAAQHGVVAYAAAKGGMLSLTRAMAVDHAPTIRVNAVLPGSVDTPMLRASAAKFSSDPETAIQSWGAMHPMGRVARPQEVANAVAFLAGPRASFITGSYLLVDGGLLSQIGGT
jgi:NAD(P)-dependent dehydrogenase (short-subunit alcohol dehydrogenase family)